MHKALSVYKNEPWLLGAALALIVFGVLVLNSIAPSLFPFYFFYIVAGFLFLFIFSQIDFEILTIFSRHLFFICILFLALPLVVGEVTRGATRWIQIGSVTIQPTELVRPFLILFYAQFLATQKLSRNRILLATVLLMAPVILILLQPSLGVAVLTLAGFGGASLTLRYNKKLLLFVLLALVASAPVFWVFMAPYQKERVAALISPASDPAGAGYHSIQSMIAVGSGQISGRGLGEGVQTQLYFLPERHSDFVFASISEEMGLMGSVLLLALLFYLMYRIVVVLESARNPTARAFVAGVFAAFFLQIVVHVGMNMGLLPITGQPLPLVSAGGSSFVATMTTLGIVLQAKRKSQLY